MFRYPILPILACWACFTSCGTKAEPDDCAGITPPAVVTYDDQIATFFVDNCLLCHSANSQERNGAPPNVNFDSYILAQPLATLANSQIQTNQMPRTPGGGVSPLGCEDKVLFQAWIAQGTLEN